MLAKIKAFFDTELQENDNVSEEKLNLACAALLIEVAVIDQEFDDKEFAQMQSILQSEFSVNEEDCKALISLAQQESEESSSMYQFTQLVNEYCDYQRKFKIVKGMWDIAYADGELDKYEEYIIRKTSELLHFAHGDFIRAKHAARANKK